MKGNKRGGAFGSRTASLVYKRSALFRNHSNFESQRGPTVDAGETVDCEKVTERFVFNFYFFKYKMAVTGARSIVTLKKSHFEHENARIEKYTVSFCRCIRLLLRQG